jgi:hypothetical protein
MTPDEKPSREERAEEVAARLRAGGLDARRDGENITVFERPKPVAEPGASTGKNIGLVLGVTLGSALVALLLSLIWFGLVFSVLGGGEVDMADAGRRAGQVGFTLAAAIGGFGALITGVERRNPAGGRDMAALIVGVVLGVPLLLIAVLSLGMTMDALTRGYGKAGIISAAVFIGGTIFIGNRFFKKR